MARANAIKKRLNRDNNCADSNTPDKNGAKPTGILGTQKDKGIGHQGVGIQDSGPGNANQIPNEKYQIPAGAYRSAMMPWVSASAPLRQPVPLQQVPAALPPGFTMMNECERK